MRRNLGAVAGEWAHRDRSQAIRRRALRNALFYLALAAWALGATIGWKIGGRSDDKSVHDWTAWLMGFPSGRWLVAIVGTIVVVNGLAVCAKAFSEQARKQLPDASGWIAVLGRIGTLARGLVFVLIGGFLIEAGLHASSREAKGLAGALRSLEQHTYGWVLLGMAGAGLLAFGVYQIVLAAYRKVDIPRL